MELGRDCWKRSLGTSWPNDEWPKKFYINEEEDDIVEKTLFEPTFSNTNPDIDEVIEVEGLPAGTEVFLDSVSVGTMEDTTLTFTATEAGLFIVVLKKDKYYDYMQEIMVKRFGEWI